MRRLVFFLLAFGMVFPALAQETPYEDHAGYYRMIVPSELAIESGEGYAQLTAPSDAISVALLAVEALTIEAGIEFGWALVEPNFALQPYSVRETRLIEGADDGLTIIYDVTGHPRYDNSIVQAYGYQVGDLVYVWLFRGDANIAYQRASDIQLIMGSFKITAP